MYRYTMKTRKSTLKNIVSGCVVRSEHHVDILNTKLTGKEHLTSSLPFIEKSVSFWDSIKKFKWGHQRQAHNQKLFRAGYVSGNQSISINNLLIT